MIDEKTEIPTPKISGFDLNDVARIVKNKEAVTFFSPDTGIATFLISLGYKAAAVGTCDIAIHASGDPRQNAWWLTSEKSALEGFDYIGVDNGIYIYRKC